MPDRTPASRIDILDSTWIHARPAAVALAVGQPANWRRWWPTLELTVAEARGVDGVRWLVRSVAELPAAALSGRGEIWLQPADDGVLVHFFLWLDPAPGSTVTDREVELVARRYRELAKQAFWALADRLDPDRVTRHTSTGHASSSRG